MISLSKHKNKLYRLARRSKNQESCNIYKLIRNKLRSTTRIKKSEYFKNFLKENNTSSTVLWKKLDPYINPNKSST